ncbi:MAG: hypothetical protein JRI68_30715, partial [Deltaproteobacteria bacterium]|nr:hypothetical protein [Deltaproteobacteria bacterium]
MATKHKALYASAAAASVALFTLPTAAQIDVDPPLPNLMLLVDTSGSMEYLTSGDPVASCNPTGASDLNRWATLVSVLTGSVQNRGCYAQVRNSPDFVHEYGLNGDPPYDKTYFLPYHRIVSNGCVAGPGALPANLYDWPNNAINYHAYDDANQACAVPFEQSKDGLMDVYRDRVRFGLMTFDPKPHGGTGVSGGAPDFGNGMLGMWSYYNNWQGGGSPIQGSLPGCAVKLLEVGARNAAAPPWEGRMISVGRYDAPLIEIQQGNDHIQEALLTLRPYGATPLAAMLADAYVYFRQDNSPDPVNPGSDFGHAQDPMVTDGCRKNYMLVLSDGEPNLDLRPYCEANGGTCPYKEPWEVAGDLANTGTANEQVLTFAVGFGLSADAGVDCNTISMPTDLQSGGICDNPSNSSLKACCTLSRIAYEGGTPKAYFANDVTTLKVELQNIIDSVAGGATSRTMPAFAGAVSTQASNSGADAVSYEFTTSFTPGIGELWAGNLERHRWDCEDVNGALVPVLQEVKPELGDDFANNLNQGKLTKPRQFYTVLADPEQQGGVTVRDSEGTIRPDLTQDDGLGLDGGVTVGGSESLVSTIMGTVPEAMDMVPPPAACAEANLAAGSASQCAQRVMKWELGGVNGGGLPSRSGNEFGAIYHATPDVIGAPRAYIRDPSYERFANEKVTRPLVLYTATTDGQLHAFKVASNDPNDTGILVDKPENNELWSFLPPHVLPNLISQYPSVQQILLDGPPVLKDVVFERTLAEAKA